MSIKHFNKQFLMLVLSTHSQRAFEKSSQNLVVKIVFTSITFSLFKGTTSAIANELFGNGFDVNSLSLKDELNVV